jgi:3'(2'), 5'-bisphosphate nucleotidase
VVASRSHRTPETDRFIEELKQEFGSAALVSAGSSLKFCLVAEGKADIYPRFGRTMEWDVAAGHAILLAAGKDVRSYPEYAIFPYNKPDLGNGWFIAR